ncbi:MAG: NAD-dependent dehydratase [Gammaproteobacteria bacterium TMED34]|nr:MAG: NAD-dependent dehydratase [Gammaproteobacteria bacterium TMED34]
MSSQNKLVSVVTGGAGFIGSHLVDRLLAEGDEVIVIDNYSTGRPENLAHISDGSAIDVIEADIASTDIARHFEHAHRVFHLAALADIVPSINYPEHYYRANVQGTFNVVEAAKNSSVNRFVYAASSTCYGIPDIYPTPESSQIQPQYPYALTKNLGEQIVMHWAQVYGLSALSLRLFNVYGLRSRTSGSYGAVFGVFLAQKLAGKPYTVVGNGEQTRDFTYVTDVVDAFVSTANSDVRGECINVGSGNTYSVNRLVELLGGEVTYVPKRPGEPDCTFADTTKIEKLLNWSARVPLEDGVREMLEHIDYWREAPVWTPDSISDATRDWFKYLGDG